MRGVLALFAAVVATTAWGFATWIAYHHGHHGWAFFMFVQATIVALGTATELVP